METKERPEKKRELADVVRDVTGKISGMDTRLIRDDMDLRGDLQLDELELCEILMELEDLLGIDLDPNRLTSIFTYGELVKYVQGPGNA